MRASGEIVIERPREAVRRWATNPERWQFEDPEAGAQYTADYEITESRAPSLQVIRAVSGPRFESTLELSEDVGGTRVRQTVDAGPGDPLTRFAFIFVRRRVRRDMGRHIHGQLTRLKELVELEAAL